MNGITIDGWERPVFFVPPSWIDCEELLGELRALEAGGTTEVRVLERLGEPGVPLSTYLAGRV